MTSLEWCREKNEEFVFVVFNAMEKDYPMFIVDRTQKDAISTQVNILTWS
jgi:hypothetical protein